MLPLSKHASGVRLRAYRYLMLSRKEVYKYIYIYTWYIHNAVRLIIHAEHKKEENKRGNLRTKKENWRRDSMCAAHTTIYSVLYIHLFVLKGEEGSECRLTREAEERRRKGGEKKRKNCKWAHHTKWYLVCDVKPQVSIDIIVQFDSFMQNKSKKTAGEPKNKKKEKEKNEGTAPILHYYTRYSLLHFVKPELG